VIDTTEEFRVFAYDLNTNTFIAEIPASGLTFDSRLDDDGACSFYANLQSPQVAVQLADVLGYAGNPFAIYIDRNGTIVWGGICWTGLYTKSSGKIEFGGKEFGSYFGQRVAAADYSESTYPAGLNPATLIYKIYTDAQNAALAGLGASIGLNVVAGATSIPLIIPGYPIAQLTTVKQIAEDMAAISYPGAGGIDTAITVAYDTNGIPTRTLNIYSPRVGRIAGTTGLIFDLSNVIDYTWPTDSTQVGNTIFALGAGNGDAQPRQVVQSGSPVGGLGQAPRLDKVVTTTAQSADQIALMANGLAQQYGAPLRTPTVTIATDADPALGTWIIGDDARLYLQEDERFPNGLDEYWRIVQQSVAVPDEGKATVTLTFNPPPIY
jgi:hypothetical protein